MKTIYQLSNDYHLLYQLAKAGFEIPCWFYPYSKSRYRKDVGVVKPDLSIGFRASVNTCFFYYYNKEQSDKEKFIIDCNLLHVEYIQPTLHAGEWIIADIIGLGIYEIVSFSDYHVNVMLKKRFLDGWNDSGHITCCHRRPEKIGLVRWLTYKRIRRR